ncbi:MAG: hypothetical protein LQ352_004285 [Teloschistes flavicans]|nr:MAG: hypothetical protein LQ352_004285 [Teloschistes flavicans]
MPSSKSPNSFLTIDVSGTSCSERSICHALIFFAVDRMRGYCGRVFVSSSILCWVEYNTSGLSVKKLDESSPKPERCVGFESLGGGDGDGDDNKSDGEDDNKTEDENKSKEEHTKTKDHDKPTQTSIPRSTNAKTTNEPSSSAAVCNMRTLPPAPATPPSEAPPTSTFLKDFSAAPETNTGTGSYGTNTASKTQASAASTSLVSSSGAACGIKTLPPAPATPPSEAPPTSTFLTDFSAAPETNTGTGFSRTDTASGTRHPDTGTVSRTGTQSMSSGTSAAACAIKSLPPAPENPPAEAPPTSSTDLGTFSAAPETNTGTGLVSATGAGGTSRSQSSTGKGDIQPNKSKHRSSMQTSAPAKTNSKSAPATTKPSGIGPLSDCSLAQCSNSHREINPNPDLLHLRRRHNRRNKHSNPRLNSIFRLRGYALPNYSFAYNRSAQANTHSSGPRRSPFSPKLQARTSRQGQRRTQRQDVVCRPRLLRSIQHERAIPFERD